MNLKGFRTIIVGLFGVIGIPALTYIAGIDWTALGISPVVSAVITSAVFMALRFVSSTSVFKQTPVPAVVAMSDEELRKAGVVKILTSAAPAGRALAEATPGEVVQEIGFGRHT